MSKYKIVAICQIYNELERGNLKRFIKYLKPLVDEIVVYDDGSTDGSYEFLKKITPNIIRSEKNDFLGEVGHRQILLDKARELKADFILWLDADEVLSAGAEKRLPELCRYCEENGLDALDMHELNLYRSLSWRRVDSLYDEGWFPRLWRLSEKLSFSEVRGLHKDEFIPEGLTKREKTALLSVIHYGFSSDESIAYKYLTYRSYGQKGFFLDRLVDETNLKLKEVDRGLFPTSLYKADMKPKKRSYEESLSAVLAFEHKVFRPKYSIVCLIYKSVDWLKFINEQVLKYTDLSDKEFFFIANDADESVLQYLRNNYLPHYVFNNTPNDRKQWYINNVYRAWNFGAKQAKGDFIVFINSDMGLSENWLENLIKFYDGSNCVASRLVESGKLKSAKPAVSKNFGRSVTKYKENAFSQYAKLVAEQKLENGGLFMPLLIRRDHFLEVGGYPEGNIVKGSNIFKPRIAKPGDKLTSGDVVLMEKLKTIGINHQTSFASVVYHFQCGEMDDKTHPESSERVEVAIANDIAGGSMGERVLWNFMLEGLPGAYALDYKTTGADHASFPRKAKKFIKDNHPQTKLIIQNGTFIKKISNDIYTISLVQDDLRSMGKVSIEQEANLKSSQKVVANSLATAISYNDLAPDIIPIGLDSELFKPGDKVKLRKQFGLKINQTIGIFVGSFSAVKGFDEIRKAIKTYPKIHWILVTKKEEQFNARNVTVFNRIDQKKLAQLLGMSDFFILGSPVETQCLAALEAALCGLPLVMHRVGIFKQFSDNDLGSLGYFGGDLVWGVKHVLKGNYNPRKVIIDKKLTITKTIEAWEKLVEKAVLAQNMALVNRNSALAKNNLFGLRLELTLRKKIIKRLIGREYFELNRVLGRDNIVRLGGIALARLGLLKVVKRILGVK